VPGFLSAGDVVNNPRFVNAPTAPDCAQPGADCTSAVCDMGAFEYPAPALKFIDGDTTLERGWGVMDSVQPHGPMTPILTELPFAVAFSSVSTPDGPLTFNVPMYVSFVSGPDCCLPAYWSHGGPIGGEIWAQWAPASANTILTAPAGTGALDLYVQPDTAASPLSVGVSGTTSDGWTITVFKSVGGVDPLLQSGGAAHAGFYASEPGVTLASVTVAPSTAFIAEVRYGMTEPADLNLDGVVSGFDLALLLGAWGPCPTRDESCPADLDGNDVVNGLDLAVLLAAWGS
jgi:hypothetical protein